MNRLLVALAFLLLPALALADPTDDQLTAAQQLCLQFRVTPTTCDAPSRTSAGARRICAPDEPAEYDDAHPECAAVERLIASRLDAIRSAEAAKAAAVQKRMQADQASRAIDASAWVKGLVGE